MKRSKVTDYAALNILISDDACSVRTKTPLLQLYSQRCFCSRMHQGKGFSSTYAAYTHHTSI